MELSSRGITRRRVLLFLCSLPAIFLLFIVLSETSDSDSITMMGMPKIQRKTYRGDLQLQGCAGCNEKKDLKIVLTRSCFHDVDITATYTDASGAIRVRRMKSKDLSASWIWESPDSNNQEGQKNYTGNGASSERYRTYPEQSNQSSTDAYLHTELINPVKLQRMQLRQKRRELRTAELIQQNFITQEQLEAAAIERSKQFNSTIMGKNSIWRRDFENPNSESTLKLIKDQIIMAKVYAGIALSSQENELHDSLMEHIKESQHVIREANFDAELQLGAIEQAKAMGHILSLSKDKLYDPDAIARKMRAMVQHAEERVNAQKKRSTFLVQLAAKTVPKPLHCLPLQLTTDYYSNQHNHLVLPNIEKLEDPALYHYAIFSDNVLATSVVVNSTIKNAKEPEKHVFHIVTDGLNFAAMKMWFLVHHPPGATINVENINEFKWLNSSYCSVLRQLESARLKEYYFKMNRPSSLSAGVDNLKYRNPKYLSMLNHLRFYMPEIYPKLDKILFLDDDVVVQKDLTPLWSIDMKGMVNGAVETCKESFHRFETYLNFSNPMISQNFDPRACGWAFGMNIFDLREWKKQNITGIYHYWQDLNEDRQLWKLGSLPPGLITFYNLTYPLERSWHVLGLGYDPTIDTSKIDEAGVIHYNGNYKPWLDLAFVKYKKYWTKYVMFDNPYLQLCHLNHC